MKVRRAHLAVIALGALVAIAMFLPAAPAAAQTGAPATPQEMVATYSALADAILAVSSIL